MSAVSSRVARLLDRSLDRRSLGQRATAFALAGVAAPLAAPALVRGAESTPAAATPATGAWTFTDDAGNTVTLAKRPERIVADLNAASALWDFGIRPVAVTGWTVATDAAWGNVDRSTPNISAGPETGAPDPEQYLGMKPDLLVTIVWGDEATPYNWTFSDDGSYEQMKSIAPVIGISASGRADRNLERFAELAALLGADLETPEIAAAKQTYEDTVAEFKQVAAEKSDVSLLFVGALEDTAYLANPADWADLAMYLALGLNVVTPEGVEPGGFWLSISPEQVGKHPADLWMASTRSESQTPEQLRVHPAYQQHPAIKAGQIGPWNQDMIQSYQGLTSGMNDVLGALRDAKPLAD